MTHHIRRLFLSPLPAFEGEMAALCTEVPPAVVAASKCLAICIEVSIRLLDLPSIFLTILRYHRMMTLSPQPSTRSLTPFHTVVRFSRRALRRSEPIQA